MKDGFLLVDKPAGPTAHDVVDSVRRSLGSRKVGHIGTLDPFATGLLVILAGRATRLSQFLVGLRKEYAGTIRLGVSTDSHDLTGELLATSDSWQSLGREQIDVELQALTGRQLQRPPAFSALKVGGERAYRLARQGRAVELPAREIEVFEFVLTDVNLADLSFRCEVSSGTYVRALARDLGCALGCGANLTSLRRLSVGPFKVDSAQSLADVETGSPHVRPSLDAVGHMQQHLIENQTQLEKFLHGQPIPISLGGSGMIAVSSGRNLVAIAELGDGVLKPRVVLEG